MQIKRSHLLSLALVLAVFISSAIGPAAAGAYANPTAAVFINEIHYDDSTAAGDTNEGVEIAGPAGTDLSTYSIVLYNGSGGASYDTDSFAGTIPNQQAGFGAVWMGYPVNGVQNGSPDGIALVHSGAVVQFLCYEGTFAATNGPASGMTCTDISVAESNATEPGTSLQLSGAGRTYGDFTWQAPAAHTRGMINTGQTFPPQDDLTITKTGPLWVNPGDPLTYQIRVHNTSASLPAADVTLVDTFPSGITYVSDTSGFSPAVNGQVTTWSLGSVDPGTSVTFDVLADSDPAIASGTQLTNTVQVTASLSGDDLTNNTARWTVAFSNLPAVDLSLAKSGPAAANANSSLVYHLTVANLDAAHTATGVLLVDTLPAGVTYVSDTSGITPKIPSAGVYAWDLGDLAAGANISFDITVQAGNIPSGQSRTNTALVSSAHTDPTPANNTASAATTFTQLTRIYTIQGSGAATSMSGQTVTTEGIVVGDYEGASPNLRGFYLQDPSGDGSSATSDGIFVYNAANTDLVSLGERVLVTGSVSENQGQTQISLSSLSKLGAGAVTPSDVSFPLASASDLERFEGMLVKVPQTLYVTEHFQLGRFGQVLLSANARLQQPTNVVLPGAPALALQAANDLNKIILDDATNDQNRDPILFGRGGLPLSAGNSLRGGDSITNLVGVMTYTWSGNVASGSAYRLRPISALGGGAPNFQPANPRPASPGPLGGTLRVASMNLLNYFNTFDGLPDTTDNCDYGVGGPPVDCRGADTQAEFNRQYPKTVAAILKLDPDVLGIVEIENDGYGPGSAIQHLVNQLNLSAGPGAYAFIDVDAAAGQQNALGSDAIKVGLIYQPASVTPTGSTAVLNSAAFVTGGDSENRNRPSLAQAFQQRSNGAVFIIDVNHFKSKGSACNDPDAGDGQANCNVVRTNAANLLTAWLAGDPTGTGDADIVIMGDLNAYAMEDPITAIKTAGYTNLLLTYGGAAAYSYVFDGQWGYLDHALGSASLASQVAGLSVYPINADEPSVLDYNTDFKSAAQQAALYAADEFRVSDHDPVLLGLDLQSPTVVIDAGPADPTNQTAAAFSFTGSDSALGYGLGAYACQLDGAPSTPGAASTSGAPWAACSSGVTYTGLTAGRHTFAVHVTDLKGNRSLDATYSWTIDTTAPTASIDVHPAAMTSDTSAIFVFSGDDGSGSGLGAYACQLDGGAWNADCSNPTRYDNLAGGEHSFAVRVSDLAGNLSPIESFTWTIDTVLPTVAIDTHPAALTSQASATFTFSAADARLAPAALAGFDCRLDQAPFAACTSPTIYTHLADGPHTFQVRARDTAGNASSTAGFAWTVDSTAPAAPLLTSPADAAVLDYALTRPVFTGTAEPGATVRVYRLDSAAPGGYSLLCTASAADTGAWSCPSGAALAPGAQSVVAMAVDPAGNASPYSNAITFLIQFVRFLSLINR